MTGRYLYANVTLNRVIDGDTVVLTIDCGFNFHRRKQSDGVSYRLARINAPELSAPGGPEAKFALTQYFLMPVRVETLRDPDKYGRFLVELEAFIGDNWVNVNNAMVEAGYAAFRDYA